MTIIENKKRGKNKMGLKENAALKLSVLLNLKAEGATVYGEVNDYHFSINQIPYGNATVWQLTMLLDKTLSTDTQTNLKKTHKINIQYTALDITPTYQAVAYNIVLNMPMSKEKQVNYFNNLITTLTNMLANEGINNIENCGLCGVTKEDEDVEYAVYKGLYIKLHKSCIEAAYEEQRREIEKENKNIKRLPISIILAFLGAVVGIIPSVISIFGFGWLFGILFAICPIASFFGYKLGKAPLRWYATLIAAICSLIVTALVIILFGLLVAAAANATLQEVFADSELGLGALLGQALLFDIVGIACAFGYISKTRSGKITK